MLMTPVSQAANVIGVSRTITSATPPDSYNVSASGTLIVNGATTLGITVANSVLEVNSGSQTGNITVNAGSQVQVTGARVAASTNTAFGLNNATATIATSTITNTNATGVGLQAARTAGLTSGSTANVSDSTITGRVAGATATAFSVLNFQNTRVEGLNPTGFGVLLLGATGTFTGSSVIVGGAEGVRITNDPNIQQPATLTLDGSTAQGRAGAAIRVNSITATQINVINDSKLLSGSNVLLQVDNTTNAAVDLNVNASQLTGNIVATPASVTQVKLDNGSSLTGQLVNVASMTVGDRSQWNLVGDSQVKALQMQGGTVAFGPTGTTPTLSVETLSGNGNFALNTDFAAGKSAFLDVKGRASGDFVLEARATGAEPDQERVIPVVRVGDDGGVNFTLKGKDGRVDAGAYSYGLTRNGNDWQLDTENKTISPSTGTALALQNASQNAQVAESHVLRMRVAELRSYSTEGTSQDSAPAGAMNLLPRSARNDTRPGVWMRGYGNEYNGSADSGLNYNQRQNGISFGADWAVPDTHWLAGVTGGYSRSNLNLKQGSSGTVKSSSIGVYGTYIDPKDGGDYLDLLAKLNHFENDATVSMSDGNLAKGNYKTLGATLSAEYGRHYLLGRGYYVEPFVYTGLFFSRGRDYQLDNGLKVQADNSRTSLSKLGATVGRNWVLSNGYRVQPYLRGAVTYTLTGDNNVLVNDKAFRNDIQGPGVEIGLGVALSTSNEQQFFADFQSGRSEHLDQPWGVSLGYHLNF